MIVLTAIVFRTRQAMSLQLPTYFVKEYDVIPTVDIRIIICPFRRVVVGQNPLPSESG